MKKVISFRLSDDARKRLAEIAAERRLSQSRIVEDLILGDPPEMVSVDSPRVSPSGLSKGVSVKLSSRPGTSQVRRQTIQKPDWKC